VIGEFACLEVKMIGKPYAGELQVRFDEGEQDFVLRSILNGHEAGKRWTQPRADLTNVAPVLYSTYALVLSFGGKEKAMKSKKIFSDVKIIETEFYDQVLQSHICCKKT